MHVGETPWLVRFWLGMAVMLMNGCGAEGESVDAPTPSVRTPTHSLTDPLTDEEVATFLNVVADLPDGQIPEFAPLSQVTAADRLRAPQLADIYRQEYRAMFDAARHGERWRKDQRLMQTFKRFHIEAEDFAALMIRMSCAVAANAVSSRVNLSEASLRAQQQLQQTVSQIERVDAAPPSVDRQQRRQPLLDALQELVALSEFSRILIDVPPASREVIARHRQELVHHLPETGSVELFERTVESRIVPTGFERSQPTR